MTQEAKNQPNQEAQNPEEKLHQEGTQTSQEAAAEQTTEAAAESEKQVEQAPAEAQDHTVEEQKQNEASEKEKTEEQPVAEKQEAPAEDTAEAPKAAAEEQKAAKEEAPGEEKTEAANEKADDTSDEREFYDFGEDSESTDDDDDDDEKDAEEQQEGEEELPDYEAWEREQLVKQLEELVAQEDTLEHKRKIALIKVAYLKKTDMEKAAELEKESEEKEQATGEKKEDKEEKKQPKKDELAERFNAAFGKYKEKRTKFREEQEKLQQENLKKKQAILEELRELINSEETLKKTYDDFKELQEKWKEIGMVPKAEVNELWKNYHFLVEKFFDKVKINKELRDLDLKKNLEQKIELCEKAEELILETSVNKSFKELQILHEKYRQIGPVPADKKEEVWTRFKGATEKIHDRRRKHYENMEQQQEKNLDAKTALCEKMEALLKNEYNSVKDWNLASDEVKELMKLWRSIGFVPKQYNESIWNRFKTSVDSFFENKKEFFKVLKDEQRDNYNRKLNLCMEAEALKDNTDWKKTTRDLINLQKEWKKIGPVSRKHSDKLWKRFRAANDAFFNAKEEHFKTLKDQEKENLKKKEELLEKIKNHDFGDNKNENLEMLKEIQREWMSIGFVPIDKKDKIQKEYQDIINKRMDELSISNVDVNSSQYKSHVENLKDMPGGDRQLRKERGNMMGKINKLKEDVKLWENNTGFLANSKNAEVLKKEFQQKIDKAKREIALLEAQMKILND